MRIEGLGFIDKSDPARTKLRMANKSQFQYDLNLFDEHTKVLFTVETFKDVRTLSQNGRMHLYFDKIAKYTGMDNQQVKSVLKLKFLLRDLTDKDGNVVVDESTGEVMKYVEHTHLLDQDEAEIFLREIEMWALDFLSLNVTERIKK